MIIEAPDRRLAAGQEVAVPFKGTCLIGRVLENYDGGRGATIKVAFDGQSRVHGLARYDMHAAGEGYVLRDGTLARPMIYSVALRQVLRLADGLVADMADDSGVHYSALLAAREFVESHIAEIDGWTPRLAAPAEGWSAEALDGGDAPWEDVGSALRYALGLAGEAVGEDVGAFVAAVRHGAKLHRRDDGRWVVLDQENTPMWTADYASREEAASSYCRHHRIEPRKAAGECLASEFDRVAYEVAQELVSLHVDELVAMATPAPAPR